LTFSAGDWSVAQTVTVTAVNDLIDEGGHTSTITHTASSSDTNYDGIAIGDVVGSITDNDSASVNLIESGGSTAVSESGPTSDTYTLVLNSQPLVDVTVTATPDGQTDAGGGAGTPLAIVFTPTDWNSPQTITVLAVPDGVSEGLHTSSISHTTSSGDGNYHGLLVSTVVATIIDTTGVTMVETGGTTDVSENGPTSDTYTIVLNSPPAVDVTITASPDSQSSLGLGPGNPITLTFTPADWNVDRLVVVTAVDDANIEGNHTSSITHAVTSTDGGYDAITVSDVYANITDNEVSGTSIAESADVTNVSEAGPTSDSYTVVLDSKPAADVAIIADPDDQVDLGDGPGAAITLTFTDGDWDRHQTVTVTAVDDAIDEGSHTATINHTSVSTDGDYNGVSIAGVTTIVADNDVAGIILSESGGATAVSESGPTSDIYSVVLRSEPTANVTVIANPDDQADAGEGPGSPRSFVFTPANWNTMQTITVTAVDDAIDEGSQTSLITHLVTSSDPGYNGATTADLNALVDHNDLAGITASETGGSTDVSENGPTSDTYAVVLNSQPAVDVAITASPDSQTSLGLGPGNPITLTFTPADWNLPRLVVVTAANNAVADGGRTSRIVHTASSSDPNYNAISIGDVMANISDDDVAGIALSESGGSTTVGESGPTFDTYTIVLTSQPATAVTISIDPDGQTSLGSGSGAAVTLTFTSGNWDLAQTVKVTAVDDSLIQGPHDSTITHWVDSEDEKSSGIAIRRVVVNIADDDTAEFAGATTETPNTSETPVLPFSHRNEPDSDGDGLIDAIDVDDDDSGNRDDHEGIPIGGPLNTPCAPFGLELAVTYLCFWLTGPRRQRMIRTESERQKKGLR
jgi:hypothetical protein